jgi:hypothetical protein
MEEKRRGRPKGSKDGPRPENAPPRGRPRLQNDATSDDEGLCLRASLALH